MHTVTFYSFKGGVGRTLALVNIGVELAKTGRKVLLVDFDLEAPGIDTFCDLAPTQPCGGIVDYVTQYLATGRPPDFGEFHYQAENLRDDPGGLWVMPAGRRDAAYGAKLAAIDWPELYEQRDGFLLIEHLKSQWKESISPDYVLIDSRTGHTEVGGICTRQLPDTVVVLFIPNEQNLEGVSTVVDAIREENSERKVERADRRDAIKIELVASNVPSLDDEYQILRKMMRKFESRLIADKTPRRGRPISTINRYDSMHLLNQAIFVTERPQSNLAKQYRRLLERIVEHNLEDREAAMREISSQFPRPSHTRRFSLRASDFESIISDDAEKSIKNVLSHHADDAEINFMIGQLHKSRGDLNDAELFFSRAAEIAIPQNDPNSAKYQLEMLETLINKGKAEGTVARLVEVLSSELNPAEFRQAVGLLVRVEHSPPDEWLELRSFVAVKSTDLDALAWASCSNRNWQQFAVEVYRISLGEEAKSIKSRNDGNLLLAAIGTKNFDLVLDSIAHEEVLAHADIQTCFNFAMAKWGKQQQPDVELFSRVIELADNDRSASDANYQQCLALCFAIVGDKDAAVARLDGSRRLAGEFAPSEFSCWRYLRVDGREFTVDLDEIQRFIDGHSIVPEFMR